MTAQWAMRFTYIRQILAGNVAYIADALIIATTDTIYATRITMRYTLSAGVI